MENERRIGSGGIKVSAMAQRGPMAMKVKFCLLAPLIPLKAPVELNEVAVMLVTYCGKPADVSHGETTTVGAELKVPAVKVTLT
jgi:hypothetical protein